MTAAALTNIAYLKPESREDALAALERIVQAMLTKEIRRYEVMHWGHDALDHLEDGRGQIGYLGHLNLALGAHCLLGGGEKFRTLHENVSNALAKRLEAGAGLHAETFPNAWFTGDNTIVLATLRHYDTCRGQHFAPLISRWVEYTRGTLLDPGLKMVVYYVTPDGKPLGTPRGVLQGWNSLWLPHVDEQFARFQYELMKLNLAERLPYTGFGGVREYPRGVNGPSDIIAGPVVAGVSGAATAFAIGGARFWRDEKFLDQLLATAELVGSTLSWKGKRMYLFAPLVGDAIVLAALTNTVWDERFMAHDQTAVQ